MKFGVWCELFQDAPTLVEMAVEAEQAGWDGFFIWDTVVFSIEETFPIADPWVVLGAIAANTKRIRIGTMVTPLPRRRPWVVARETVSVDRLSNGRLTLGVGLGEGPDLENFGEETDLKVRAAQLDEGLDLLTKLWTGERVDHRGEHYRAEGVTFLPKPLQSPRIPIWVGGYWPNKAPVRRAARYDGAFMIVVENGRFSTPPEVIREVAVNVQQYRTTDAAFDIVGCGVTHRSKPREASQLMRQYADAGATWYLEAVDHYSLSLTQMRQRTRQSPPGA